MFRSAKPGAVLDLRKPWRLVRAEAGLPGDFGLHGLRHSLASHMALGGAEAAQIMHAMGHNQLSTVQRYLHAADAARRELANRAALIPAQALSKATAEGVVLKVLPLPTPRGRR